MSMFKILSGTLLPIFATAAALTCNTQSQPNPISAQYPNLTTGTINGTIAILPIPLTQARSIIPSQYGILTASYKALLPDFPDSMYPAMLQTELDHDVGQGTAIKIPDFQLTIDVPATKRASISYPFVDRLNDGYTAMTYGPNILISANLVSILGSDLYGTLATPATFDPPCDAYAADATGATYFDATVLANLSGGPAIATRFRTVGGSPYSLQFWKNVTNQPQFGSDPLLCDNYIRLFNSTVTTGLYVPTTVQGNVTAVAPYFPASTTFANVYGLRLDNAFIENNFMSCESLKGYSGTGSGD